jgi:tetratricopeptide (TPR) repeat protein
MHRQGRSGRGPLTVAVALAAIVALAPAAWADPAEDCSQADDMARRVAGCTAVLKDFPALAAALSNRGQGYASLGKLDEAMADLGKALAADPKLGAAWYNRATVRITKGDTGGAIADLTQAIATDPDSSEPLELRGQTLRTAGRTDEALADLDAAMSALKSGRARATRRGRWLIWKRRWRWRATMPACASTGHHCCISAATT